MTGGTGKRAVYLKNTGSPYFEEAIFILSPAAGDVVSADVAEEARRIVDKYSRRYCKKRTAASKAVWPLVVTLIIIAAATLVLALMR